LCISTKVSRLEREEEEEEEEKYLAGVSLMNASFLPDRAALPPAAMPVVSGQHNSNRINISDRHTWIEFPKIGTAAICRYAFSLCCLVSSRIDGSLPTIFILHLSRLNQKS
jgi:hypothetical protein